MNSMLYFLQGILFDPDFVFIKSGVLLRWKELLSLTPGMVWKAFILLVFSE